MQKGTMMMGIADGVVQITNTLAKVSKRAKEEGLITEKENAYIAKVFGERIKEGNQYIEKVKDLLSPKQNISEEEKTKMLAQMYAVIKNYVASAKKFEKGFTKLCLQRSQRLTDTQEIERLLTEKQNKKIKPEKQKA